jgi:NADH-quinone oxidoreductase subunit C
MLLSRFPGLEETSGPVGFWTLRVPPERLLELGEELRLAFPHLSCLTAVDFRDRLELVYLLYSQDQKERLCLKVDLPPEEPVVDSVTGIWPTADWQEREVYDMFGIRFRGHPNLKRILLWEGYEGHPLRKDFGDPRPPRARKVRTR